MEILELPVGAKGEVKHLGTGPTDGGGGGGARSPVRVPLVAEKKTLTKRDDAQPHIKVFSI